MDLLFNALITLVVVIDPVGVAATYGALTAHSAPPERDRIARKGVWISAAILYFFALTGNAFLGTLGITIAAFRIAGGILLFFLAIEMILVRQSGMRSATDLEKAEAECRKDITVFPLAIPLIAGPGAITSVVLLMGGAWREPWIAAGMLGVIGVALLITFASLRLSGILIRALGVTGTQVVGRVLGILLAALAVQFVLDGLRGAGLLPHF
jgi:multiple antibiotic resistance protein